MNKVARFFQNSNNTTLIRNGLLVGGGIYLIWKLGNTLFPGDEQKAGMEADLSKITINTGKMSISMTEARLIAHNLLMAMDRYGTDETTIKNNLRPLNKDDLLMVIREFGIREYNGVSQPVGLDKLIYSVPLNLIGWLKAEMDGSDIEEVRQIFTTNGIPF